MKASIELVKQLRGETLASIGEVNKALVEAKGNLDDARKLLQKRGFEQASKKATRATGEGVIEVYVHGNGKIGVMVELQCETDFVARTDEFKTLGHEVAMQVAAMNPQDVTSLKKQEYIRDASKTIEQLVQETIAKLGENITLARFTRFEVGEKR